MTFKENPLVFLTKMTWKYSAGNRHIVILYSAMFVIANAAWLLEPLLLAKILNIIQTQGVTDGSMKDIFLFCGLFVALNLFFWLFHGPARVIENRNAFLCRANYKQHLIDGTLNLPADWHTDHHSGDTIDKIEKGTKGLFNYASTTFDVIANIIRLFGSITALIIFNLHSVYIVVFLTVMCFFTILTFDRTLIPQYIRLNRYENKVAEKIFDVISNVTTVIILRIERLVSSSIYRRIMEPFRLFIRNNKINETKWCIVSMIIGAMTALVIGSYIYFGYKAGETILVGTIGALYGYVRNIGSTFYTFAWKYGEMTK